MQKLVVKVEVKADMAKIILAVAVLLSLLLR